MKKHIYHWRDLHAVIRAMGFDPYGRLQRAIAAGTVEKLDEGLYKINPRKVFNPARRKAGLKAGRTTKKKAALAR